MVPGGLGVIILAAFLEIGSRSLLSSRTSIFPLPLCRTYFPLFSFFKFFCPLPYPRSHLLPSLLLFLPCLLPPHSPFLQKSKQSGVLLKTGTLPTSHMAPTETGLVQLVHSLLADVLIPAGKGSCR